MNFEQKYLKYQAKNLEVDDKLDASLFVYSIEYDKKIKNTQNALEKHNRNISVLEQAIYGRINKIRNTEDQKKRGIENLTKNNTHKTEIDEVIKSYDSEINDVKKEIEIKTRELEHQRKLVEKLKLR